MIAREDILHAYEIALARRSERAHRVRRAETRQNEGTEFVEIQIAEDDPAARKTIHDIATSLPEECIPVSIRRGEQTIIPHGDDVILAGDLLTVFATTSAVTPMMECLKAPESVGAA